LEKKLEDISSKFVKEQNKIKLLQERYNTELKAAETEAARILGHNIVLQDQLEHRRIQHNLMRQSLLTAAQFIGDLNKDAGERLTGTIPNEIPKMSIVPAGIDINELLKMMQKAGLPLPAVPPKSSSSDLQPDVNQEDDGDIENSEDGQEEKEAQEKKVEEEVARKKAEKEEAARKKKKEEEPVVVTTKRRGDQRNVDIAERERTPTIHQCPHCQYSSFRPSTLDSHVKTAHKEKCFPCTLCTNVYRSKTALANHMQKHTQWRFPCPVEGCSEGFKSRVELSNHGVKHGGEKNYPCLPCNIGFSKKDDFTRHCTTGKHLKNAATREEFEMPDYRMTQRCPYKLGNGSHCPFTHVNNNMFNRHIQQHENKNDDRYT
jgi:hypothetical protein